MAAYTWPGSSWRPSACWADVIATRPQVLVGALSPLASVTLRLCSMPISPHLLCMVTAALVICKQEIRCTRGLVAMTSAQHAEGRQFDPGRVYLAALRNGCKVNAEAQILLQATLCRDSLK